MTIHAGLFVPGLLLLLFPADRLLSSLVQLRGFDCFQSLENSRRYRPWWWVPALWLDPLRAFFGARLLMASLDSPLREWMAVPRIEYALVIGALVVSVVCQLITRRDSDVLLAPIGFVVGVVVALTPLTVAAIGVPMAVAGMFAFRNFGAFFGVGFATLAFLGFVLGANVVWLVPALAVVGLPLVAIAVTGRTLEVPTRDSSSPAIGA